MITVRKHSLPANDRYAGKPRKMTYVVLRPTSSRGKKIAETGIFSFLVFAAAFMLGAHLQPVLVPLEPILIPQRPVVFQVVQEKPSESYDIVLNADSSELQSVPVQEGSLAEAAIPAIEELAIQPPKLAPLFEVTVEDNKAKNKEINDKAQAENYAGVAKDFFRQGDLVQAMRYQYRAVELMPSNMSYRLELAVLFDRASNAEGARQLYQQVVQAYGKHDATLPAKIDIESIRRRLDYLNRTAH
jgi:hypothetical protein